MGTQKKILIVYANAGAGHRKAALAISKAFAEMNRNDIEVRVVDSLDYCTPFMKYMYLQTYLFMIAQTPTIWGLCYYIFDSRVIYKPWIAFLRRLNNGAGCKGFERFLLDYKPDVIVNTHFLGSEVMASMRRRGLLKEAKLMSVVTDYMMHSFWIDNEIDIFCVAQEASKKDIMRRGVPEAKVRVTGIPVDPLFGRAKDKAELRRRLKIPEAGFTVLLTSGGFGVGPLKELVEGLGREKSNMQLIVVCGKNPRLFDDIKAIKDGCKMPVTVYEYVDNMDELMELADIIVTKSGGLTSSEALAKDLPLIIISAIPGQEARNSKFLLDAKAAIQATGVAKVEEALKRLAASPRSIDALAENVRAVKRPRAAHDVAGSVLELMK